MKKIFVKLKPLLVKLLEKIDQVEQKLTLQKKVKHKHKIVFPDWIYSFIILLLLFFGFTIKQLYRSGNVLEVFSRAIGFFIVVYFLVVLLTRYYVKKIRKQLNIKEVEYKNNLKLFLTLTFIQTCFFILWQINNLNWYLIPAVGFVVLTGLLLDLWWTVVYVLLNSVIGSYLCANTTTEMFTYMFVYTLTSIYVLTQIEKISSRHDIIIVVAKSAIVNFIISVCINLVMFYDIHKMFNFNLNFNIFVNSSDFNILNFAESNVLNAILNWLIVISLLSPFEVGYQRTTSIKLVEMSNFNHPLLNRLVTEAPGTYHHSVVVASLAENVALNLGINALLCKVGGFYHDIGKIIHPSYFIENQLAIKNPHEEINPSLSALIILNHVKEGVKLANQYKLDKPIVDIIEQHHGNSTIFGLQSKNLELNFFDKEILRYPGPKPQTKEAAVIMICDSCEAACRSLQDREPQRIKETVEYVINSKFVDGQFDEVPFTLRELYVISNILTQLLISFYHPRSSSEQKV